MEYILPAVFAGLATGFGFLSMKLRREVKELEQEVEALGYRLALAYDQISYWEGAQEQIQSRWFQTEEERNQFLLERNLLLGIVQAKAPEHIKYLDAETVEIYPTEFDIPRSADEEEIGVYDTDDEEWARGLGYEAAWPGALAVTDGD